MKWIMIVWVTSSYGSVTMPASVETIGTFNDEAACEAALSEWIGDDRTHKGICVQGNLIYEDD